MPGELPEDSWPMLDSINLKELFLLRVPMLRSCPVFLRGRWCHALRTALDARRAAKLAGQADGEKREWKLLGILLLMLLHRPKDQGSVGRAVLEQHFDDFASGR